MLTAPRSFGALLREWRTRRHLSQLDLAGEASISARHLSFLETGRATPSREMIVCLAEQLDVPLRERNALLIAAGYAPTYPQRSLGEEALRAARSAVELVLRGHEPYPALAVDRHWTLLSANAAVTPLLTEIAPELLSPPVNVLRLSLHPDGLAPHIVNFAQWRAHLLARLRAQIEATADVVLQDLLRELQAYPNDGGELPTRSEDHFAGLAVPLRLCTARGVLSFMSTTTVFGTPLDVTLSELAIESFFPAETLLVKSTGQMAK